MHDPLDPLSLPLLIPDLARRLHEIGIEVSAATLYRMIRDGELASSAIGRKRSTVRAFLAATAPADRMPRHGRPATERSGAGE